MDARMAAAIIYISFAVMTGVPWVARTVVCISVRSAVTVLTRVRRAVIDKGTVCTVIISTGTQTGISVPEVKARTTVTTRNINALVDVRTVEAISSEPFNTCAREILPINTGTRGVRVTRR